MSDAPLFAAIHPARAFPGLWRVDALLPRHLRVTLLVALIAALNFLDLGYTLTEVQRRQFQELNPLAASLLSVSPTWLIAYKLALCAAGCGILLVLRRRPLAEAAAWLMTGVFVNLMSHWSDYYSHVVIALSDPATGICPLQGTAY